jgi:hypothetical protein
MTEPVYRFRVRCNTTGEVRSVTDTWPYSVEGLMFYWTDGSMACDCNRESAFRDAGGEIYDAEAIGCLPRGRYTVIDVTMPDGEVLTVDDDEFSG